MMDHLIIAGKICDEYAIKDDRIKVIHKQNCGLPAARNSGVEVACGDYITFVDSDDWIDCNMYKNMMAKNDNYDIIRTEYIKHDGENELYRHEPPYEELKLLDCTKERDELFRLLYDMKIHATVVCMIIKKDLINKIFPFDTTVQLGEDLLIATQLFCNCNNIMFLPEHYYYYYQNDNSISLNINRLYKNIDDLLLLRNKIFGILKKYNKSSDMLRNGFTKCIFIKAHQLVAKAKDKKEFKNVIKYAFEHERFREMIRELIVGDLSLNEKVFYYFAKYKLVVLTYIVYKIK